MKKVFLFTLILLNFSFYYSQQFSIETLSDMLIYKKYAQFIKIDSLLVDEKTEVSIAYITNDYFGFKQPICEKKNDSIFLFSGFYASKYADSKIKEIKLVIAGKEVAKAIFYPNGIMRSLSYFDSQMIRDALNFNLKDFNEFLIANNLIGLNHFDKSSGTKLFAGLLKNNIIENEQKRIYVANKYDEKGKLNLKAEVFLDKNYFSDKENLQTKFSKYKKDISQNEIDFFQLFKDKVVLEITDDGFKRFVRNMKKQGLTFESEKPRKEDYIFTPKKLWKVNIENGLFKDVEFNSDNQIVFEKTLEILKKKKMIKTISSADFLKQKTGLDDDYFVIKNKIAQLNIFEHLKFRIIEPKKENSKTYNLIYETNGLGELNGVFEKTDSLNQVLIKGSYKNIKKEGEWAEYDTKYQVKKSIVFYESNYPVRQTGQLYLVNKIENIDSFIKEGKNRLNLDEIQSCKNLKCSDEDILQSLIITFTKY